MVAISPASFAMEMHVIEVHLDENDRLDWALKKFKKKVQRAGLMQDLRRKRHYTKPSEARQLKAQAARRRRRVRAR
jgi:small subunit ribosomal protein S21